MENNILEKFTNIGKQMKHLSYKPEVQQKNEKLNYAKLYDYVTIYNIYG